MARKKYEKKKRKLTYVILQIEKKQAQEWGYSNRWIKMEINDLYDQGLTKHVTEKETFTDEELIKAVVKYVALPPEFLEGYQVKRPHKVPEYVLVTKE